VVLILLPSTPRGCPEPRLSRVLALVLLLLTVTCGPTRGPQPEVFAELAQAAPPGAFASPQEEGPVAEPPQEPPPSLPPTTGDGLLYEGRSAFSHFKVVDEQGSRYLLFVQDDGAEVIESGILLASPHTLIVPYTRAMFASQLLRPRPERCLIVGLGGGAMVHFLRRYLPETAVDVVEIDPAVVDVARRYFGVASGGRVRVFTEDAFAYIGRTKERYDVIFMDAFLKPGEGMDDSGVPLRLKTRAFHERLRSLLTPGGLLVLNYHWHRDTWNDLALLRDTFPTLYRFPVEGRGNVIVVGSTSARRVDAFSLREAGRRLDAEGEPGFSFERLAATLDER
jgi:spermidine synthase